jgi:hypothetical protein
MFTSKTISKFFKFWFYNSLKNDLNWRREKQKIIRHAIKIEQCINSIGQCGDYGTFKQQLKSTENMVDNFIKQYYFLTPILCEKLLQNITFKRKQIFHETSIS